MSPKLFCFEVDSNFSIDEVVEELEKKGVQIAYSDEDENSKLIYGYYEDNIDVLRSKNICQISPYKLPEIDWESQWELHGLNYHNGFIYVNLNENGKENSLKLQSGPGFGDLSHPTTRLALKLLTHNNLNTTVIDIGCGSGILSLAAAVLGATQVFGIDIDPEALKHSKTNCELNGLANRCQFLLPSEFSIHPDSSATIIMNMIQSEQKEAWASLPSLHYLSAHCITSGIRKEERNEYLKLTKIWGWKLLEELEEDEWMAFLFSMNSINE